MVLQISVVVPTKASGIFATSLSGIDDIFIVVVPEVVGGGGAKTTTHKLTRKIESSRFYGFLFLFLWSDDSW